jgi:hypothetical protein
MLSPHLIRQVEQHADRLAESLVDELLQHPHTTHYRRLARPELLAHSRELHGQLGEWLAGRSNAEIDAKFGPRGRDRFVEGVPLEEVVLALILAKRQLRRHTKEGSGLATAAEIHAEMEVDAMVGAFYDKVLYAMVRGYEEARREAAHPPRPGRPMLGEMKPGNIGWVP